MKKNPHLLLKTDKQRTSIATHEQSQSKRLHKFKLPSVCQLLENTPAKEAWKKQVKMAFIGYYVKELLSDKENQSSCTYINSDVCHCNQLLGRPKNVDVRGPKFMNMYFLVLKWHVTADMNCAKQMVKMEFGIEAQGAGDPGFQRANTVVDTRPVDRTPVFMDAILEVLNTAHNTYTRDGAY